MLLSDHIVREDVPTGVPGALVVATAKVLLGLGVAVRRRTATKCNLIGLESVVHIMLVRNDALRSFDALFLRGFESIAYSRLSAYITSIKPLVHVKKR